MSHILSDAAESDLLAIWNYIREESGNDVVADRQVDAIADRFFLPACYSRIGRVRGDDLGPGRRTYPVNRYIIVYSIRNADVHILRVAHSAPDLKALMTGV